MARSRNLKPGFFTNELLGAGDPLAQLLYAGLWCLADASGTLEDRPARIKAEVFPHRPADVGALLDQLAAQGFVVRYQAAGRRLLHLPTFLEHQKPHYSEKPKGFALPLDKQASTNPENSGEIRPLTDSLFPLPSSLNPDSLEGSEPPAASEPTPDRAKTFGSTKAALPGEASPCSCADPVVLTFPVVGGGGQGPAEWPLTRSKIAEYQQTFPALDVLRHCRVACQWCRDNETKRKTPKGMPAFLTRWLAKEQDRGNVVPIKPDATPQARKERVAAERAAAEAERRQAEADHAEMRRLLEQARHSRNGSQGKRDA